MKVKWSEFNQWGYDRAIERYPYDAKIEDFTSLHEGEILHVFVANNVPHFVVIEDNKFVAVKATDCEIIK